MPEEIKTDLNEQAAANNAEVTQKLEAQTIATLPGGETELKESSDALDTLLAKKQSDQKAADDTEVDEPPVVAPVITAPAVAEPTPEEKAAAEEKVRLQQRADDIFKDSPRLPSGASPKSTEAFSTIKVKAAQEIAARDSQLEAANKKLAEYEAKLKDAVPPEIVSELEDHRQWRAKLDVEADPKFKEFDKQVASSEEFIYAQLSKNPAIGRGVIDQIKKLGGPESVDMEKVFAVANDPTLRRLVEAKIADIAQAKWSKEQAITSTKANIKQYLEERTQAFSQSVDSHNVETKKQLDSIVGRFEWSKERADDPKATPEVRKAISEHNTFVANTKQQLEEAMHDVTPGMRAALLAAAAQAIWLRRENGSITTELAAAKKSLTEANEKLEKLKSASVGRFKEAGGAPPGGKIETKPKESDMFNQRADVALDNLAKQVVAERARAGAV